MSIAKLVENIGQVMHRELPPQTLPVAASVLVGHVAHLAMHVADGKASDGRTIDVVAPLAGGTVVTITRPDGEPFVVTFTVQALVQAALAAEQAHHEAQHTAPAQEGAPRP